MLWFPRLRYRYRRLGQKEPFSLLQVFVLGFCIVYLIALLLTRSFSQRDPTSFFFNPNKGYQRIYSHLRQEQAEAFIQQVSSREHYSAVTKFNPEKRSKSLCVGVATVARKDVRYFRAAIGSLLEGLDPHERERLYIVLFIAHTDPTVHPAFSEAWLDIVADEILLYNKSVAATQIDYLRKLENDKKSFYDKPLFDYTYLLQACYNTSAPHMILFEDDIIAMDGWFHRTDAGLREMEEVAVKDRAIPPPLYLRLFYTEKYLGWNREHWPIYLGWSVAFASMLTIVFTLAWKYIPSSQVVFSKRNALVFYGFCLPLIISLFFMSGKMTACPLPRGVNRMDNFGCCSQGLAFPRDMVPDLIHWYQEKKAGFVDMLTEQYADKFGYSRWALTPSVIQHVGGKTSKDDGLNRGGRGLTEAETIWNFEFEHFRAVDLREDHDLALSDNES